jgi:predicted O-methyltransferase YrrM
MKMNDIPGWFSGSHQIEIIKLLLKYNHPDCVGVEVGCLHGRSSYSISVAISKGTLYCIDTWDGKDTYDEFWSDTEIVKHNFPPKGFYNTKEIFLKNIEDRKNIIPIQGASPEIVKDWTKPIDFIFLDATHKNPNDRDNIDFWLPKIKPGGTFLGHDWYEGGTVFPDVNLNVEYMEDLLKQKVTIIPKTSMWYFTLPKI